MDCKLSNPVDLCRKSNSILGPNETQLTINSLRIKESKKQRFLSTINQRKHYSYLINFHHDQLLSQLMKEDGHIEVNHLIIPKSTVNQQTYRWDELSKPTALNKSIQLRRIRQIHNYNNNDNTGVQVTKSSPNQINDNSKIDKMTLKIDRPNYKNRSRTSRFSPRSSKEKSPPSTSSLDEDEVNDVQQKLNNLQSLFIQMKNQIDLSTIDQNDYENINKVDQKLLSNNQSSELNQSKADEMNAEEHKENIDEHDSFVNLPNYATFSVKKSHQYAVENWLFSNFNHI